MLLLGNDVTLNYTCLFLGHWDPLTHKSSTELRHHWFRWWPVTCLTSSHYLNQCWIIVNWAIVKLKLKDKKKFFKDQNLKTNAFEDVVCKMSAILFRHHYVKYKGLPCEEAIESHFTTVSCTYHVHHTLRLHPKTPGYLLKNVISFHNVFTVINVLFLYETGSIHWILCSNIT